MMRLVEPNRPIMYGIVLPGPNVEVGPSVPIVKGGDVRPYRLKLELLNRTTPELEAPYARARLAEGDIVYSIRGTIGDAELVPAELAGANITQDVARIAPRVGVEPRWLLYAAKSLPVFAQLDQLSLGAAVRGINIFDLKRARVPTPAIAVQRQIADELDALTSRLQSLKAHCLKHIDRLREYRSSLISAAVTGQLDLGAFKEAAVSTPPGNFMRPQTIQIYLPGGDPRGIRVAELTTRIVQVLEVPRSLLGDFLKMPESRQVAVYFLVGHGTDAEDPKVYVGQSSDMPMRFASHNSGKDFWQKALVLISRTHSLTQTHALFLEWMCLQEAKKAARYVTTNGNNASRPYTPAPLEADCYEIFDTGRTLLSTLGYPCSSRLYAQSRRAKRLNFCFSGALGVRAAATTPRKASSSCRAPAVGARASPLSKGLLTSDSESNS
jgi:predicted GIY-YIG superfamily endonuclease